METNAELERLQAELTARDEALAASEARVVVLEARVGVLEELVRKQMERLNQHSGNSNLPPSSDKPGKSGEMTKRQKKGAGRRRGGQKGHKGSHRRLLLPEQVNEFVELFPPECENCWAPLPEVLDSSAKRTQHTELKPLMPHVTEYRRHAVTCLGCGHKTRAAYDASRIPRGAFGPRLMAVAALLTGVYHLSRRQAVQLMWELLGVRISTGSLSNIERRVSNAVQPAVDEAWDKAMDAPVKHTDGTSWLQAGVMLSLWTVATATTTVFRILSNGRAKTLKEQVLTKLCGVLVSDRATALKFWAMENRQICWAHLLRKFVSFSERDGPAGALGRELLDGTRILFTYWADFRNGDLTRTQLAACIAPVRKDFEATLQRAMAADVLGFSGSCADMWAHRKALWTFVGQDGVEPTNNHAERELRGFVLWRKRSFGTQSDRGNRFAERMMSVAHTARKQGKNVLAFLVASCKRRLHEPVPSLFEPDVQLA